MLANLQVSLVLGVEKVTNSVTRLVEAAGASTSLLIVDFNVRHFNLVRQVGVVGRPFLDSSEELSCCERDDTLVGAVWQGELRAKTWSVTYIPS